VRSQLHGLKGVNTHDCLWPVVAPTRYLKRAIEIPSTRSLLRRTHFDENLSVGFSLQEQTPNCDHCADVVYTHVVMLKQVPKTNQENYCKQAITLIEVSWLAHPAQLSEMAI
jgi:hypothetical protein